MIQKLKKMKTIKYSGIAFAMAAAALLSSCQADMDTPALDVPEASVKANITLLDIKEAYSDLYSQKVYMPGTWVDYKGRHLEKDKVGTVDPETNVILNIEGGEPVYVHGRVVSSDASGNIYKSLVIQDETAALAFSINQGSLYNEYRLGQEMVVDLTGLYMGYYRGLQQVGYPSDPYDGTPQLGFMALDYWLANAQYQGLPDPEYVNVRLGGNYPDNKYYCITFDSFDDLNKGTLTELQSQFVEFRDVSFEIKEGEETYAPYQESVNRTLVDASGQTLTVRNSGYSNFYNQKLPTGRGIVRGILSYYGDSWQLVLRDVRDVVMTDKGTAEKPFEVADILTGDFAGMTGWSKGYIVGSVKAGVTSVTDASDVIFGSAAEMDNNVLIAASADETDFTKCAVVELTQSTQLRYYVNLLDNPGNLKKELAVYGKLGSFLGLDGVIDSKGTFDDFTIDGQSFAGGAPLPPVAGSGTEADPYNITYVMESTGDQADVWVTGYVAGYVTSGNFSESSCEFSANEVPGSSNYLNSTNVLISAVAPMNCGYKNSVPCQLTAAYKPTLGLANNPGVYGKQVKIKCRITTWLGSRALRNISQVVIL